MLLKFVTLEHGKTPTMENWRKQLRFQWKKINGATYVTLPMDFIQIYKLFNLSRLSDEYSSKGFPDISDLIRLSFSV